MLAVEFTDKQVQVVEKPSPKDANTSNTSRASDEVLVRVRACGICGSDLTILDSGFRIAGTPGHEIGGELEDGTAVAIEPIEPCMGCEPCEDGDYQVCRKGNETIYGIARDGGMAEYLRVPARCIVPLPKGVDPRNACLVEPLAVAVHGVRRAHLDENHRVLVIGGGSIGLTTALAARAAGVQVDLVARHDAQKRAAQAFGAQLVPSGAGGDYDVVFDCAGTESSGTEACDALRPRGLFLMLAPSWDKVILPGMSLAAKELNLRVSMMYGATINTKTRSKTEDWGTAKGLQRDVDVAARLLGQHEEIAENLISHRFPLSEAPAAIQKARERKAGALKVVLEP